MIDEWSSELTLALKRMVTDVSTAQRFIFCFGAFWMGECCCVNLELILPCFCFALGGSHEKFASSLHMSPCYVVFVTLA